MKAHIEELARTPHRHTVQHLGTRLAARVARGGGLPLLGRRLAVAVTQLLGTFGAEQPTGGTGLGVGRHGEALGALGAILELARLGAHVEPVHLARDLVVVFLRRSRPCLFLVESLALLDPCDGLVLGRFSFPLFGRDLLGWILILILFDLAGFGIGGRLLLGVSLTSRKVEQVAVGRDTLGLYA